MSDLHARDRHDPDWGGPVADLVEEDRVVGIAYVDDGELYAEFYPDEEGNPWVYDVGDLQRVLDTVRAMLGAGGQPEAAAPQGEEGQHPVDALAMQFDNLAARRGPEDEGFYPTRVAAAIVARSSELGLAVAYLEGVTVHADGIDPLQGHKVDLGEANAADDAPFALFQAECNTQAAALLERWPDRPGFAVAVEVEDATGERFVL